jgi:Concanavalin A-like lectin/glucanases superfamily
MIFMLFSMGCSSNSFFKDKSSAANPDNATVWKLDSLKSIGGQTPQVLGSPIISSGAAMQFNGQSDGLFVPVNPIQGMKEFTIELHFKPDAHGPAEQRFMHVQDQANSRGLLELRMTDAGWSLDAFLLCGTSQRALLDTTKVHPADQWTWVAMTYKDGKLTSYVNGQKELDGDVNFAPMGPGQISLGVRQNKISWFKGMIGEVRFHPVALDEKILQK